MVRIYALLACLTICTPNALVLANSAVPSSVAVSGLRYQVQIFVDHWGVPHIYASTIDDAFFAQGWNAARDRLWQMDIWRRSGLGELSAILGPSFVNEDRAIRLFTYRGDMAQEWAAYGPEAKRNSEAFVSGVNAYILSILNNTELLPLEFKLLGYYPSLWGVDDLVRVRNHGLAVGVESEVFRAKLTCTKHGLNAADLVMPISPPWKLTTPRDVDLCAIPDDVLNQYRLALQSVAFDSAANVQASPVQTSLLRLKSNGIGREGSNNWVISPLKSASGRPILANDPHRALELPSLRYIAHVVAPGMNVLGAGEPALPGVAIGHNERIAFGITVFPVSQEDLCIYDTDPKDPNSYRYGDAWEPLKVYHESIAVRDGTEVQVEIKFTRHGPVIYEDREHHRAYAVRATWLNAGGAPYFGAMRYLRAGSLQEFNDALNHWGEPGENHVYADITGTIAWLPAGTTPIRFTSDGLLPVPGDGQYEWLGYLEQGLLPSEINPSRGYIATANQMNLPPAFPYAERRVGFGWADDYRFNRITDVLSQKKKISISDSMALQNDYLSLPALRVVNILKGIQISNKELSRVADWLSTWDGRITADSAQAALFEVWCSHHLVPAVVSRVAPGDSARLVGLSIGSSMPMPILELIERPDDRLGSDPVRARDEILLRTLSTAILETRKHLGSHMSEWKWGRLATVLFEHPLAPLVDAGARASLNIGPLPKSGDANTVSAAVYGSQGYRAKVGATFRIVMDVGSWDNSMGVNAPGQSGDPSSVHYRDLVPLWIKGEYFPLVYSESRVRSSAEQTIVLRPQ